MNAVDAPAEEREGFRERLIHAQFRTIERLAMSLPERVGRPAFAAAGRLAFRRSSRVRAVVARNLGQVLGKDPASPLVQEATREAFALYGRFWYDAFRVRTYDPATIIRKFRIEGLENIDRGLAQGRGAIAALPHMGNWDAAGKFLASSGYNMVAVAEELQPRSMYEFFLRHRQALGMRIVPLTRDKRAGMEIGRLLLENWAVCLVADRDLSGTGVEVEMFGETRKLPAGPALLSLRTGAPLLPACVYTTEDGWFCRIQEPLAIEVTGDTRTDVTALTRALATEFERAIAANPVDWHMFQPAWEDTPESARAESPHSMAAGRS